MASRGDTHTATATGSAFAPLRVPVFRRLWGANLVSNLGFWMQQIAAGWLMTELTGSAALVALLATAAALPTFLLAVPAGALADVVDRRRLIIATQVWQLAVSTALGVLAISDAMTPGLLLAGTALYGVGATLGMPPQSAIIPELVERDELTEAIALNSTGFTASQAIGPALGGALVAGVGAGWAFLANAVSFVGVVIVFVTWRRTPPAGGLPAEHVLSAMRTGVRYVAFSPAFRLVLLRLAIHMLCYAAIPALLVIAVRDHLGASAGGYGLALGAFGAGGVASALLLLPRLRGRLSVDALTASGAVVFALATFGGTALAGSLGAALPFLVLGGAASMLTLSSLQASTQKALPDWVRGRGLAVTQLTFQAAMAAGAAIWGAIASGQGVVTALLAAGGTLIVLTLLSIAAGARLGTIEDLDLQPATPWAGAGASAAGAAAPDDGPLTVLVEYDVDPGDADAFRDAMREVGRARRRDGALHWSLATDLADPSRHVETWTVGSVAEHQRELARLTREDEVHLKVAQSLHSGGDAPAVRQLLGHHGRLHLPGSLARIVHVHRHGDGARGDAGASGDGARGDAGTSGDA